MSARRAMEYAPVSNTSLPLSFSGPPHAVSPQLSARSPPRAICALLLSKNEKGLHAVWSEKKSGEGGGEEEEERRRGRLAILRVGCANRRAETLEEEEEKKRASRSGESVGFLAPVEKLNGRTEAKATRSERGEGKKTGGRREKACKKRRSTE